MIRKVKMMNEVNETIKAYNEGYRQGKRDAEKQYINTAMLMINEIEELTDKHWEECRQIALYDDELRQVKANAE